jgi:hypothetical protein
MLLRRRAEAIIVFTGHVVEQTPTIFTDKCLSPDAIDRLLATLLELAQASEQEQEVKEIRVAARAAIGDCLRAMPAAQFISSVAAVMEVPKPSVSRTYIFQTR